ncbi:hypothetical protein [Pectobacterium sp. B2J-2]|uniref:hypothetical protein n=1 Tax=Pectobacterium sp. B2J-2 TaxID=3385372 RepID=UPI0038FD1497
MSATKEDLNDFEFIISEAIRIKKGLNTEHPIEFLKKEYNGKHGPIGMIIDTPNNANEITPKDPKKTNLSIM